MPVVDALNFGKDFGSADTVRTRNLNEDAQDSRTIVNLLIHQIEFADVIILNKTDLINPYQLGELKAVIHSLNPGARIIQSTFIKVNPKEIINTGFFDYDKSESSAGWIQELGNRKKGKVHTPETEEHGIGSFVFRDKRPFHAERFWNYLSEDWHASIIRIKGLF